LAWKKGDATAGEMVHSSVEKKVFEQVALSATRSVV
jgi:hypothetical protein